jgi:hypothetical protein
MPAAGIENGKGGIAMEHRYYIAYGSNLNKEQMAERCPGARVVGVSELKDYRLMFKGSLTGSYLTVEPEEGCTAPVGVWEVTAAHERSLDRYEGYPTFYYKTGMTLPVRDPETGEVRTLNAFLYIMHEDRSLGLPTGGYVDVCRQGYRDFGFDESTLAEALAFTRDHRGEE